MRPDIRTELFPVRFGRSPENVVVVRPQTHIPSEASPNILD